MLSFKNVENILNKYGYENEKNILWGANKVKTRAVIPVGPLVIHSYDKIYNYYFRFSKDGINLIRIQNATFDVVEDNSLIEWKYIKELKIKKGILSNSMVIVTDNAKLEFVISKVVAGDNKWIKENMEHLESINYYYEKNK